LGKSRTNGTFKSDLKNLTFTINHTQNGIAKSMYIKTCSYLKFYILGRTQIPQNEGERIKNWNPIPILDTIPEADL